MLLKYLLFHGLSILSEMLFTKCSCPSQSSSQEKKKQDLYSQADMGSNPSVAAYQGYDSSEIAQYLSFSFLHGKMGKIISVSKDC